MQEHDYRQFEYSLKKNGKREKNNKVERVTINRCGWESRTGELKYLNATTEI